MKWTFLKGYLKEYWWVIAIIVMTPPLLNCVLSIPAFCRIVGVDTDWLSFYGGYIGAVITSLITLYVLYKQLMQNHKENDANRTLQLNIFQYEQEKQWLRKACIDNIIAYNPNYLKEICNIISFHPNTESVFNKVKELANRINKIDLIIDSLLLNNNNSNFNLKRKKYYTKYTKIINEIQALSLFINADKYKINELLSLAQDIPQNIKDLITYRIESPLFEFTNINKVLVDIAVLKITTANTIYQDLRKDTQEYLYSEETRINKILQ